MNKSEFIGTGKPMRTILLFLLLSALSLSSSGCAVLLVGAGAAGTVAYVKGDLETEEPYTVTEVFTAAKTALDDLDIARINEEKDALSAHITARDAADKKVTINITYITDHSSKLSVRISVFGSESKSRKIYQKIREHLDKKA